MDSGQDLGDGATVVITHRIRSGGTDAYEAWLKDIGPVCCRFTGHLDWQIIRPIPDLSGTYTVVIRFDTQAHLEAWMFSEERKRFVQKALPLLEDDDRFHIRTGLDIWFAPNGQVSAPMRWKQALVTWSAIFPLVLGVGLMASAVLEVSGIRLNSSLRLLLETGVVVVLMAYVVMPPYTKWLRRWLFA